MNQTATPEDLATVMDGPQGPRVRLTSSEQPFTNFASSDYLSLSSHPEVVAAAVEALRRHGFGVASARSIAGTHDLHKQLEDEIARFTGTEDAVLFPSCFDANSGLFDALGGPADLVLSDDRNHASIIDGIRLSRARRQRYPHRDVDALTTMLATDPGETTFVVTDGVFSMDGSLAPLAELRKITRHHGAVLVVDDSHGIGVLGSRGRGVAEQYGLLGEIDIVTGTLGKALGGACGGFVGCSAVVGAKLRRRARPYLFSNAVPPHIVAGSLAALRLLQEQPNLPQKARANAALLSSLLASEGFELASDDGHPIIAVMTRDLSRSKTWLRVARGHGILAAAVAYPIVPRGEERLRLQVCAGHTTEDLHRAAVALRVAREAHP